MYATNLTRFFADASSQCGKCVPVVGVTPTNDGGHQRCFEFLSAQTADGTIIATLLVENHIEKLIKCGKVFEV